MKMKWLSLIAVCAVARMYGAAYTGAAINETMIKREYCNYDAYRRAAGDKIDALVRVEKNLAAYIKRPDVAAVFERQPLVQSDFRTLHQNLARSIMLAGEAAVRRRCVDYSERVTAIPDSDIDALSELKADLERYRGSSDAAQAVRHNALLGTAFSKLHALIEAKIDQSREPRRSLRQQLDFL